MYEAIKQRVGEIIGEASMCWSETPKGVFNSEKAKELADEVMSHIEHPLEHPDDERKHILSKDCWCNPTVEDYSKD